EMIRRDGTCVAVEIEALGLEFDGLPSALVTARDLCAHRDMIARMAVADRMRSVGMLAAGVAHEVNNPLAYVLSNLSLLSEALPALLRGDAPSQLASTNLTQLLDDAREGAERVRVVVRDLRTLSRADEDHGAIDLRDVLRSSMNMAKNEMRFRARLVQQIKPIPPVRGSASRLGQIFLNLLINACQAIPPGHADDNEIQVRARALDADRVVVEITDTGCGIPPENVGRIFDPFFTTKPPGVGTGLGLAICHGLVESMGGTIAVESKPGYGTTFSVALCVDKAQTPPLESRLPPAPTARRGRVLVIDDEPAMCVTLRLLLSHEHDVVAFTCARDAVSSLQAGEQFDAILCDLMMPEMSGMAFHQTVVKAWPLLAPRMIFLTGGAFTAEAREFLEKSTNPHLEKPFDEAPLFRAIRRIVG
ncbi:MAG: ATP-binding protein, partial [Polyangiaceae bacterium]